MQRLLLSLLFIPFLCTGVSAQTAFNTTLRDNLTFSAELNDVWGYVAPDGTEYALVGRVDGVSIVSLADPDNIVEVASLSGGPSTWRDLKSFGEYAYVVADRQQEGILVIDLSDLPNSVSSQNFVSGNTSGDDLVRAHNIYIDEPTGRAYIAGANVNNGGMVIYDLATTPGTPIFEAFAPNVYAHDVYVQDGIMYASEINGGDLTLYDVSNVNNITAIGTTQTPFNFTHNAWTDASGDYVYTTDERGNASVAAYDISDLNDIELLDEFRPSRSLNRGAIPHNVHVQDDYLIISSYTDGVEIVDASVPDNLVEVAYYDHWTGGDGGFNGSWGAYPFLPSGLVLSSDITNGLFVVEVNYQRAARLRGEVTDSDSGASLNDVSIAVASTNPVTAQSAATGRYKTGIAESGTFSVTYSLAGYIAQTVQLSFTNGMETVQDIQLVRKVAVAVSGDVTSTEDGGAVAGATVRLEGEDGTAEDESDNAGNVSFTSVFTGMYQAFAGIWGFRDAEQAVNITGSGSGNSVSFQLEPGFRDGFSIDQGWTVSGDASTGDWERGAPNGTTFGNDASNPGADVNGDIGDQAYVTGNGGGGAGNDDVDGGSTILSSPVFDPADVSSEDVLITFDYWFYNAGGNGTPDDEMTVAVFNGTDRETVFTYTNANAATSAWTPANFALSDLNIPLTTSMQVEYTIGDTGGGHLVEGGVDNFEMVAMATLPVTLESFTARAAGKTALLQWNTANEVNSSHFVIERSRDGQRFSTIGRVEAAGTSDREHTYNFTDSEAGSGSSYYRLKMTDQDGSFAHSETRLVVLEDDQSEWSVYPNPAAGVVYLQNTNVQSVLVLNAAGQTIGRRTVGENGDIDTEGLSPGSYWLRVGDKMIPFVKQ